MMNSNPMTSAAAENARLAPLVMAAYGIYCRTAAIPPECAGEARRTKTADEPGTGLPGFKEAYIEGLQRMKNNWISFRSDNSIPAGSNTILNPM
jgi:hypothetical protein